MKAAAPILMTPGNATRCLDGSKTQTRRLTGLDEINGDPDAFTIAFTIVGSDEPGIVVVMRKLDGAIRSLRCPYGAKGTKLWVRETVARTLKGWLYRADYPAKPKPQTVCPPDDWCELQLKNRWVPSIHMPRRAARTILIVEELWLERLQLLTWNDAEAEGVADIATFKRLWASINKPKDGRPDTSWEANPWVWVIRFRKEKK